jgi:hypothetical protein
MRLCTTNYRGTSVALATIRATSQVARHYSKRGTMPVLTQLVWTVVQVALGAGIATTAAWISRYITQRRPAGKIWRMDSRRPIHIVTAQDESDFDAEFTVKVYPAEYLAAVEVRAILADVLKYRQVGLSTSNELPLSRSLMDNLVCIGGPIHNRVTALLLQRLDLPFTFDGYAVVSAVSGNRYEAVIDATTGKITRDVGVVVIAENPFSPSSTVVMLMGSRTFGCPAGSRLLVSGNLRGVAGHLGDKLPKWVIVDADVLDDFVARVSILEAAGDTRVPPRLKERD